MLLMIVKKKKKGFIYVKDIFLFMVKLQRTRQNTLEIQSMKYWLSIVTLNFVSPVSTQVG